MAAGFTLDSCVRVCVHRVPLVPSSGWAVWGWWVGSEWAGGDGGWLRAVGQGPEEPLLLTSQLLGTRALAGAGTFSQLITTSSVTLSAPTKIEKYLCRDFYQPVFTLAVTVPMSALCLPPFPLAILSSVSYFSWFLHFYFLLFCLTLPPFFKFLFLLSLYSPTFFFVVQLPAFTLNAMEK